MSLSKILFQTTFVDMQKSFFIVIFFCFQILSAQDRPYLHHNERVKLDSQSKTLQNFLRKGSFFGHSRFFSMATDNAEGLSDYYAHAVGVGIGYETGTWKNFTLGISGYAIYDLQSSDFSKLDSASNQPNRYELGLFDVTNPSNHHDLDRLEDLYIKYSNQKFDIKFGKQHIRSPFINPQDGRMRPTLIQGLLADYRPSKNITFHLGHITQISPRSTIAWYGVGESIGIYGQGVNVNGTKSNYAGNLPKSEIVFLGGEYTFGKYEKLQIWNQWVSHLFNTLLVQYEGGYAFGNQNQFIYGVQYMKQNTLENGGNIDQNKTYLMKNSGTEVYGLRIGMNHQTKWKLTLNYTRISDKGRYNMPREWGRDPFFTFMPRERNEGYGDVNAFTAVLSKNMGFEGLRADLSYGQFYLPEITNTALNKYGFPSYQQLNLDIRYSFQKFLKGFDIQMLYVWKKTMDAKVYLPKFEINKVNLSHYNLILNYHF